MMFIVVYEIIQGVRGGVVERPLAMFRNPREANVFLNMVQKNGRTAYSKII